VVATIRSSGATAATRQVDVATPYGLARAHLRRARAPRAALVLGHGAGGGIDARDLVAVAEAALAEHVSVALVEQPYRVAGRRAAAPAHQLDAAWTAVLERLARRELKGLPLVVGGRSSGARVACRTAEATAAVGVVCVAFPLVPPRRTAARPPSRLPELDAVRVPVLVVQGSRDPFGIPPAALGRTVVEVDGTHSLRASAASVGAAAGTWLAGLLAGSPPESAPPTRRAVRLRP
jgi:predicted alpha/beta-hydrolase family hydrolase